MVYQIKAAKCTVCETKVTTREFFYGDEPFCSDECKHAGAHLPIWTRALEHCKNPTQAEFVMWMLDEGWKKGKENHA